MSVSRRSFVRTVGLGSAGLLSIPMVGARGAEAAAGLEARRALAMPFDGDDDAEGRLLRADALRLDSNENPHGPAAAALAAIRGAIEPNRYASRSHDVRLRQAIAKSCGLAEEQVGLGHGSTETLRQAVLAFTSATKPVVVAVPTYESPARDAALFGHAVREVPTREDLSVDLDALAAASVGAGLVFLCNPNNPTGLWHRRDEIEGFIARVRRESPETTILVDEAYFELVEDPSYASAVPIAAADPKVVVSRTFSKVHGLAGLRVGYAIGTKETIAAMRRWGLPNGINAAGSAAAIASLELPPSHVATQRRLNAEAREYTAKWFRAQGYAVGESQTNFLVVDVRRDVKAFQAACRTQGVLVGRSFPRMATRARISIGTMDEMRQATELFKRALQAV